MQQLQIIKFFILISILFPSFQIFAQTPTWKPPSTSPQGMQDFRKKAEDKAKNRWTLSDWLAQKERNKMMDLWLGMYSPSPYELIIGGEYLDYAKKTDIPLSQSQLFSTRATLSFYAMALGLEGFYENNLVESYSDSGTMISIRIAGKAVQNTHLILQLGTRNKKSQTLNLQQQFVGIDMDIYVETHSGLHANYRYYSPTSELTLGTVTGRRIEGGLFFDIGPMKLFWNWYSDLQTNQSGASTVNQDRTGGLAGLKFFL